MVETTVNSDTKCSNCYNFAKRSYNSELGLISTFEANILKTRRSFYIQMFLHYLTNGTVKTLFSSKNAINCHGM